MKKLLAAALILGVAIAYTHKAPANAYTYKTTKPVLVQQGDNLFKIASRFDLNQTGKLVEEIQKLNGIGKDARLEPGQVLLVPVKGERI